MAQGIMNYQIAVKVLRQSGQYLSEIDWQNAKMNALCYDLDMVVFQPQHSEPDWLRIPQMAHPWQQSLLIDLRPFSFKKETLPLQSPFNGQKYRISWSSWLEKAICSLDCYWIMPSNNQLHSSAQTWLKTLPEDKVLQAVPSLSFPRRWHSFEDSTACLFQSLNGKYTWLVADQLCQKTTDGWVLGEFDLYRISDSRWTNSTLHLANHCPCEACDLGLQRGYFHHLYSYVPLLANRYLTLHNFCQLKFCN